jgi:hypothetical protein
MTRNNTTTPADDTPRIALDSDGEQSIYDAGFAAGYELGEKQGRKAARKKIWALLVDIEPISGGGPVSSILDAQLDLIRAALNVVLPE